ncbi:MAG: alcohol dehydrogenase [Verrucomicrobia bacterium]|nr:MAG: alcohol dehydrogenase [Verrucomicrobiota bacterium]
MSWKNRAMALLTFCALCPAGAADWPQFRGPNHDGTTAEKILRAWPKEGPHQLWKVPLKDGFSSITASRGRAFTLVRRASEGVDREVCVALDADTGKEVWAVPLGVAKYDGGGDSGTSDNKGGDGPRSTPSLDGDRVYAFSSRLVLYCLEAASGKEIWKKDLVAENAGRNISWQNAASPLIDGDLVFVAGGGPGQALLGINKQDGHVVWKGQDDLMTHSTPTVATIHGVRQVIFFTQPGLVSVEAQTGAVLWRQPFRYTTSTAMTPIVAGDIVYCSAGYGVGSGAYRVSKSGGAFSVKELWFQPANVFNNHWSTPVCKDGYLYGLFGFKEFGRCPMKCVELASGKVMWSESGFGPGGTILVDGQALVLGDAGQLALVEATPKAYTEIARSQVLGGKCWSTPSVSEGRIYARSTKEGVCLEVKP